LFFSRWYSPKEILLNKTFNEYSRHDIEKFLRGSSIACFRQSTTLQCQPSHKYLFITWVTHKNNCQLRNNHLLMPSQTKCIVQNTHREGFLIIWIPERNFTFFKIQEECNKRKRCLRFCGYLIIPFRHVSYIAYVACSSGMLWTASKRSRFAIRKLSSAWPTWSRGSAATPNRLFQLL
jgi:hypothetical protein